LFNKENKKIEYLGYNKNELFMNKEKIIKALEIGTIEWRKHAIERMLERDISRAEVKITLKKGEIIESYKTDKPFESALFFYIDSKPIHVVASLNEITNTIYIITAYIPNLAHFDKNLKTRKQNEK
jgi:hypothetical protein